MIAIVDRMRRPDWLRLLGAHWTTARDNDAPQHVRALKYLLPARGPVVEMMDRHERACLGAMGESVVVYRGCSTRRGDRQGICWSLSKAIATEFAGWHLVSGSSDNEPLLVTAVVAREAILALKLGAGESEVITLRARSRDVERLALDHTLRRQAGAGG